MALQRIPQPNRSSGPVSTTLIHGKIRRAALLIACLLMLFGQVNGRGEETTMQPIAATAVKLHGEIGRRIDLTVQRNVLALEDEGVFREKFLKPFLKVDGKRIHSKEVWGDYVGLGQHLEGVVRLAAYTRNERLLKLKDDYFQLLLASQDPDGFIGWCDGQERNERPWIIHEACYLVHALVTDAQCFNEKRSLTGARKLMDWILANAPLSKQGVHQIGLASASVRLYAVSPDERYVNWLRDVEGLIQPSKTSAPAGNGAAAKPGFHVYTDLELTCAQLELMPAFPDRTAYSTHWLTSLSSLFVQGGMLLPGTCTGTGEWGEYWNFQQKGEKFSETCATCYLIRLMHLMLANQGDSFYGDVMERAIYNGLFAAQSPDGRKLHYHVPFTGPREYFSVDTYCCPNNYRRLLGQLPEMIYYQNKEGIAVNLYESSIMNFKQRGAEVQLIQTTDYPSSGTVKIEVKPARPVDFRLSLRIPRWCPEAVVVVKGELPQTVKGGQFHAINRTWQPGDVVELRMPLPWRWVKGRMLQEGRVALMRGPVAFCFKPVNVEGYQDPKEGYKLSEEDYRRNLVLDLGSLTEPIKDETLRPNGLCAKVKAWSLRQPLFQDPDMTLILKEFIDPNGQAIYFVPNDRAKGNVVDDELIGLNVRRW